MLPEESGRTRLSGGERLGLAGGLIEMLTTGPRKLGARWRETREVLGVPDSAEMEVTAFEQNRTYTITHHKGGVRVDTLFWFEPSKGGTTVSVEFELATGGLPPGQLMPEGKVRDVLNQDLSDMKRSLEIDVP